MKRTHPFSLPSLFSFSAPPLLRKIETISSHCQPWIPSFMPFPFYLQLLFFLLFALRSPLFFLPLSRLVSADFTSPPFSIGFDATAHAAQAQKRVACGALELCKRLKQLYGREWGMLVRRQGMRVVVVSAKR